MQQVDFYILSGSKADTYLFLATLTEKAYHSNRTVFIFTNNLRESMLIDDLLWTYKNTSFLPHTLCQTKQIVEDDPILISHEPPSVQKEILINLASPVPEFTTLFDQVIEIVCEDEKNRQESRAKYRQYQQLKCKIQVTTHSL